MSCTFKTMGVVAVTICLLCPIVELFDCWDHTEQTGNDTEYTLVVVGLCVGAAYSVGRLLIRSQVFRRSFQHLGSRAATSVGPKIYRLLRKVLSFRVAHHPCSNEFALSRLLHKLNPSAVNTCSSGLACFLMASLVFETSQL